ncbi:MAG: methyl-accepting chemotaxis protein [Desulfobacter sp.]|nr:MAG: methyl-accepting chemotaxis protein [Desulfobacter sp.]
MPAHANGIKRRRYFIKRGFQARFIFRFCLILVLGAAATVALTLFNTQGSLTSTYVDSRLVIKSTSLAIMPSVILTTLLTTGLIGAVVAIVTLLASHKIAGPIYRFEKDILRIAQGDLKYRIRIRKGDQFQELAVSLNHMTQGLAQRVSAVRDKAGALAAEGDEGAVQVIKTIDEKFIL